MPEKQTMIIDLMKYPLLVFSIVLALIVLKYALGLEFGVVTELSTQGVKFSEQSQATAVALADLEAQVEELALKTDALKEHIQPSKEETLRIESKAFSVAQMVSDATAEVSRISKEIVRDKAGQLRGYIWIGNYDERWHDQKLARLDTGQPVNLPPEQIVSGSEYKVLGNMILRDGLPANDAEYFRGRANLGVVPRGSRVRVLKAPVGIDREFAIQYWSEIELVVEPSLD